MKLRYFIIDGQGQLLKVQQRKVAQLWDGHLRAQDLAGGLSGKELRLVSVVCDDHLLPKKVYLLRLPLMEGVFTEESRLTLHMFSRPDCVSPEDLRHHHTEGWPRDFFQQLAVAMDVPVKSLNVPLGIGGPLLVAAARRLPLVEALAFLR